MGESNVRLYGNGLQEEVGSLTTTVIPICAACDRYRSWTMENEDASCDAFPDGIPREIIEQGFDHRKPFQGDQGIRFRLMSEAEDKLRAYEQSR
jgi:hypothetical protein